jgi:hypothetical protein
MTSKQENRLSMYLSFKDFQTPYTAITNPLPNYTINSTLFLNTIPKIQLIAEQQKTSKKGFTDIKNNNRETLIVTTADYARKLGVYAKFTHNAVLVKEIKFSESKLRQAPDTAVRDYAQIVYDRAQANIDALTDYGITAANQTALLATINAYNASLGKPGANRTEGGQTTRQLENFFKIADTALANMDAAVEIIRLTKVDFYISYKNARKVVAKNASSLAVRGIVIDALSNKPIKGVSLSFSPDHNHNLAKGTEIATESVVKKTAEKGGFNIKSLPSGMYIVAAKKIGYADQVATVAIADGELTELNIQLSKH